MALRPAPEPDEVVDDEGTAGEEKTKGVGGTRSPMNKTGARILGGFAAAMVAWIWKGWGEPLTGVEMGDALLTSMGGACIVIAEWVLVKRERG